MSAYKHETRHGVVLSDVELTHDEVLHLEATMEAWKRAIELLDGINTRLRSVGAGAQVMGKGDCVLIDRFNVRTEEG